MISLIRFTIFKFRIPWYVLWGLFLFAGSALKAQPALNARNISLGGGGTAYLSGIESTFYNPANLAIYDRKGTVHFSLGAFGSFFEPVLSTNQPQNQFNKYADIFSPYKAGSQAITTTERTMLLKENYTGNDLTSEHLARGDVVWGGVHWQKEEQAFSLVLRSRVGSRVEVGKGWYSLDFIEEGNTEIRDFSLIKQQQVIHEISFGHAREFQFVNGLFPRINKFYIGIAPKFIIGGAYENGIYGGQYIFNDEQNATDYLRSFSFFSSGSHSNMISRYIASQNIQAAIDRELVDGFNTHPTGYGAGLDFGFTYVIPLGSDATLLDKGKNRRPVEKSLRVALSVTDIGIVRYTTSPLQLKTDEKSSRIRSEDPADAKFVGAAGQYPAFFDNAGAIPNPFFNAENRSEKSFTSSLGTSVNAGAVLDINRVKVMGDLTLGLQNTAFTNTKLMARFGIESRLLSYLPLRFGTNLAAGKPLSFGAGTGIETRHWDLSISTRILIKSSTFTTDIVGGAAAVLQFHL